MRNMGRLTISKVNRLNPETPCKDFETMDTDIEILLCYMNIYMEQLWSRTVKWAFNTKGKSLMNIP